ncbi:MAG: energy transducer TonB [Muribaculaceae bacterium]|nr:energy transducer TonB [Muribaculaceae bacterium]
MKTFRFIALALAVVVAFGGINADAKKRTSRKRTAKKTAVKKAAPTGYEYVQGNYNDESIVDFDSKELKYPPEYPGGVEGLMKFLCENIKYPKAAEKNGVQGTVVLRFIVEKSGKISNVTVLKSVDKALDREAMRVVKKIKNFIPGYNEDHAPVRVYYTLPVAFKLQ